MAFLQVPSPINTVTTFPTNTKVPLTPPRTVNTPPSPDPIYAQVEPRKPTAAVAALTPKKPSVEYADITSFRNTSDGVSVSSSNHSTTSSLTSPPLIDRSKKPASLEVKSQTSLQPQSNYSTGSSIAQQNVVSHNVQPASVSVNSHYVQPQPLKSGTGASSPRPKPTSPHSAASSYERNQAIPKDLHNEPKHIQSQVKPTQSPKSTPAQTSQPSIPQKPKQLSPDSSSSNTESNPVVNRVIKPLSSKEVDAKILRMNPSHGSIVSCFR